jgi:hypothetical protein
VRAGYCAILLAAPGLAQAATQDGAQGGSDKSDWILLATACVTLVIGRTVVHRRAKSSKATRESH